MLCKEGLWGAKDLIPLENDYIDVDIPFGYKDIKPLDSDHSLFGVLSRNCELEESGECWNQEREHERIFYSRPCSFSNNCDSNIGNAILYDTYTIVSKNGRCLLPGSIRGALISKCVDRSLPSEIRSKISNRLCFDQQFVYYSQDFIVASIRQKLGVINLVNGAEWTAKIDYNDQTCVSFTMDGVVVIPFKYDEIIARADSNFNVRIGKSWGVLTREGKEIVSVKYSQAIPNDFDNAIVTDVETGRMGVLGEDGREKVPANFNCIYIDENFIFAGYCDGENDEYPVSPFECRTGYGYWSDKKKSDGYMWSCWSKDGKMLIPARYECFDYHNMDRLSFMEKTRRIGKPLTEAEYHKVDVIFAARDGYGVYRSDDEYYPSLWGNIYDLYNMQGELLIGGFRRYEFIDELNLLKIWISFGPHVRGWILLDLDLRSVVANSDGIRHQFPKGFIFSGRPNRRRIVETTDNENDIITDGKSDGDIVAPEPINTIPIEDFF